MCCFRCDSLVELISDLRLNAFQISAASCHLDPTLKRFDLLKVMINQSFPKSEHSSGIVRSLLINKAGG